MANAANANETAQEIAKITKGYSANTYVASAIADEKIARAVDQVYQLYGLESDDQFYIFVSFSMPEDMIRAYAMEAAYAGGILVFRGIPAEETLSSFVHSRLAGFINTIGNTAPIQIDPRLFEAFEVAHVPTFVYTNQRMDEHCLEPTNCGSINKNLYYSIEGAITTQYALEWMELAGSKSASRYLKNLASGFIDNPNFNSSERKIKGITKEDFDARIRALAEENQRKMQAKKSVQIYETPWGQMIGTTPLKVRNK